MGERLPCKQEVSGSTPLSSTNVKVWREVLLVKELPPEFIREFLDNQISKMRDPRSVLRVSQG